VSGRPPGRVRIIAGAQRGRRLEVPARGEVRPTSDMVREAVFDVLGPVGGLRALDLFAGSGAMGLEALSRGAASCVFVEVDAAVSAVLRGNIELLGYRNSCRVVAADYRRAATGLVRSGERFDLLFVDPPYRMLAEVEATLSPLAPDLLAPLGIVVIEGPGSFPADFGQSLVFERDYGDTKITMVRLKE
jgi:16S rRNA (guanine966-N2)-methyltransferase